MSNNQIVRVRAEDVQESFKQGFEGVKHLTTLNAGSFVLIATFLKDIFPKQDGRLALDRFDVFLIGTSFVFFAASLAFSTFSLWALAVLLRSIRPYQQKTLRFRWYIGIPAYFFVSGLSCFGTTVLISVLELSQAAALFLYALLAMLVVGGGVYIAVRLRGASRKRPITYIIDYS
jgi:hypothetical protein